MCQYRGLWGFFLVAVFYQKQLLIMELNLSGYKTQTSDLQSLENPRAAVTMETEELLSSLELLREQMMKRKMRRIKENSNPTLAMELTFQIIDGHRLSQNWM